MNTANLTGIQHIGLPTKDLEATIQFYEGLGFQVANRSETPDGVPVVFLKLNNCVMESWVETNPALRNGAIDHISLDVRDIDAAYEEAVAGGYRITTNGIEALPFWEKGVRFFKIEGPNKESIEFCQIL